MERDVLLVEMMKCQTALQSGMAFSDVQELFFTAIGLVASDIEALNLSNSNPAEFLRAVQRDRADRLRTAELFVVSPDTHKILMAEASAGPQDFLTLRTEDLPALHGMVLLPNPELIVTATGAMTLRAISWAPVDLSPEQGVRLGAWRDRQETLSLEISPNSVGITGVRRSAARGDAPLLVSELDCLMPLDIEYDEADFEREKAQFLQRKEKYRTAGPTVDVSPGSDGATAYEGSVANFVRSYTFVLFRLLNQRLLVSPTVAEQRDGSRVGTRRESAHDRVRVVHLRTSSRSLATSTAGVERNNRWVVRMHKVHQWYPTLRQHKVIFRGPYIKGPEDKPLLTGDLVKSL